MILRLAACGVACALALPATAQMQRSGDYLLKMDADRDGRIALDEYQHWLGYAFAGMDHDHDGVLLSAEQPGGRAAPLSLAEHRARIAARFRKQDVDRDGFLDARELAAPPR